MKAKTKTEQALELMEKKGVSAAEAARALEITESAVHALRRRKAALAAGRCEHCGAPVSKKGVYIPRTGD
jgi:hypothetical protein